MFFPQQSQALVLRSEDMSSPECVQQSEVLAAEAHRTMAQARSAVASAKKNRSGFFPPSNVPSSRKGKSKGMFETVVIQADVVLDCGATETAGGVEAVQILVDAVT